MEKEKCKYFAKIQLLRHFLDPNFVNIRVFLYIFASRNAKIRRNEVEESFIYHTGDHALCRRE